MEDSVKQRIIEFIDSMNISTRAFEKKSNLSNGYLNKLRHAPSPDKLSTILEAYPMLNKTWLLTGSGEMLNNIEAKNLGSAVSMNDTATEIPFIPTAATATFVETFYDYPNDYTPDTYPVIPRNGEKLSAEEYAVFEVAGDSMTPSIRHGALILAKRIDESSWEHDAAGVVIVVYEKSVVVKRVKENRLYGSNSITLSSDNPAYGEITLARSDIRAIYRAKRIISSEII